VVLGYTLGAATESSLAEWFLSRELDQRLQISAREETAREEAARGEVLNSALHTGGLIGRLEIPRLGLTAIILEGAEASTLRCAVGHIPGTALPGSRGNVGLAGHRDRSFRRLKDAQTGDSIVVVTPQGSFHYQIAALSVVSPGDTAVLAAGKEPKLTLVTCYPFHFVGKAPRRFIVEARETARRKGSPGRELERLPTVEPEPDHGRQVRGRVALARAAEPL
jgi:LPXTG-site transpeptidase (sortase) family protein